MNKKQWFVFGACLILFSMSLAYEPASCRMGVDDVTTQSNFLACIIHYELIEITSFISGALGVTFIILGFLEPKKKAG